MSKYRTAKTPQVPQFDKHMAERIPLRILLAEDNAVNQKVALLMLERLGYRADVAGNGEEVLQAMQRQAYDVVLMDVQMPEMDGLEATRRIRGAFSQGVQPCIVAMTANAMEGDREVCLEAGMDDYISKPVQARSLVAALRRCKGQFADDSAPAPPELAPEKGDEVEASPEVLDMTVLINLKASLGRRADKKIQLLIDSFYESAERLSTEVRHAWEQGDMEVLERAAHTLKSTSATMGLMLLSELARRLEFQAREGEVEGIPELIAHLGSAHQDACTALEQARHETI